MWRAIYVGKAREPNVCLTDSALILTGLKKLDQKPAREKAQVRLYTVRSWDRAHGIYLLLTPRVTLAEHRGKSLRNLRRGLALEAHLQGLLGITAQQSRYGILFYGQDTQSKGHTR